MTRFIVSLLLVVLSVTCATAQGTFKDGETVRFNPNVRKGRLESGIPYYILKNARPANRVELVLVVNAGAVLEDDDQNGLAHFCEHMAFNGTNSFPKLELVNFLESMGVRFGADLNAYTNQDETVYLLTVPLDKSENLTKAVHVLRDWAGYVKYEDKDINDERGVVTEEWRLRRGADERVMEQHRNAMYYGSKYAKRDVIGDTNVLLRAPADNLRRFYRTWYNPLNMSIVAVGDVDPAKMEQLLRDNFTSPPSTGEKYQQRPTLVLPTHDETLISVASDPELTAASVTLMVKRPADTTVTYADYRKTIARQMAYEMVNVRLSELTRKNPPAFSSAFVGDFLLTRQNRSLYSMATAADKNVLKSMNALFTELERAKRHGFTASELERARASTLSRMETYYNERDKSESRQFADELTRHILTAESVPGIEHEWEIYQRYVPSIELAEVNAIAASMVTPQNRVITISVPEGNGYVKPTEAQVRSLLSAIESKNIAAYVDNVPTKPLVEKDPVAGKIVKTTELPDVQGKELILSNGARVVYKKTDYKNDEILFSAQSWGGQSLASEEDHFTNSVAATVIDQSGLASLPMNDLMKVLSGKNVGISPGIGMERELLSGSSSPKDLKTFFELLHLGFVSPRKDVEAFQSWKAKMKSDLANKEKSPEGTFFDTVMAVATNNHPRMRSMSESDVDKVDLEKAYNLYRERFKYGSDFSFYFVGNFDEDTLKKYCETYIGSLPSSPVKEMWKDVGIRPRKGQYRKTVYKGQEAKSFVVLTTNGPIKYDPQNRYDVIALCEVMEIQLREQMREEKGGVYFVSVQPNMDKIPEEEFAIAVIFSCNPDRVDELVSTVKREMESLQSKMVPDSLVAKVREIQIKERETALKTNRFWLSVMSQFDADGEPYSNYKLRDEFVRNLTPQRIMASAKKYLTGANFGEFVLKPDPAALKEPRSPAASQTPGQK
ncbi:MAG: insulinase family protein [Candidatus Kapabacteria bacterium]|nr:insulinase family protein [Candidatus Kapabacteria bacterium]